MTEPTARERAGVLRHKIQGGLSDREVGIVEQAILAAEAAAGAYTMEKIRAARDETDQGLYTLYIDKIEKLESQVAALREALHGIMAYLGADDEDAMRQELCRASAMSVLAATAASAEAYTARIREKALEEAATAILCTDLPNECVYLDAEGSSFGVIARERMFYAQIIRALATPPATEEAK